MIVGDLLYAFVLGAVVGYAIAVAVRIW